MRLAYLILAHHKPLQLERLVKRLASDKSDVYIHLDRKSNISDFAFIGAKNIFFIKDRTAIAWANYSMIEATVKSFKEILSTDNNYSHINLLSSQDYPLKSNREIEEFLFANTDKTFMRYRDIKKEWPESWSRIALYSLGDYKLKYKYQLQKLLNNVLPHRKPPRGMTAYGFSQWITITAEAANYSITYLKNNPRLRRFFRRTWGVDELVFQTILLNSPYKETVVNDHLRYIKFIERASRPNTLTINDAQKLTESNKLFARKFDAEVDSEILDYLDSVAK